MFSRLHKAFGQNIKGKPLNVHFGELKLIPNWVLKLIFLIILNHFLILYTNGMGNALKYCACLLDHLIFFRKKCYIICDGNQIILKHTKMIWYKITTN